MLDCLRFLGMSNFNEIESMTLDEYELRMKAYRLGEVDKEYYIYLQAWTNSNVQATKKQGKDKIVPVFQTFKQFFDYEKRLEEAFGGCGDNEQEKRLKSIAVKVQEYERRRMNSGNL